MGRLEEEEAEEEAEEIPRRNRAGEGRRPQVEIRPKPLFFLQKSSPARESGPRLALYGGTFDPIHHGHLILARDAIEALELESVIFIPAGLSPHKLDTSPTPPHLRREMTARAIEGEPRFALDASELERNGPSFTIDTVEATRARHPEARLFYLVGSDNVAKLSTWHRFADLQTLVEFVVFDREQASVAQPYHVLPRRVDISATEIRARVARGDSIRYLVPEPVREIIEQNRLYH